MSAPTVEKPGAPVEQPVLPWPLRIIAGLGRVLLRIRRFLRRVGHSIARAVEWVWRSPVVAAPIAAASVALTGLLAMGLLVAGAWWGGVEPPGPWQEAAAVAGSAWVMSFGVPVRLLGVDHSLLPWGLALIPAWLSYRSGMWLVRVVRPRRWRSLLVTGVLTVLVGAGLLAAVSVVSDIPDVQTSARRALVMAVIVIGTSVTVGMWRCSDILRNATKRIPLAIRVIVRASFVGFAALVGFAAAVLVAATIGSFGEIGTVFTALQPTVFDGVVLLVLALGYLPTLIGWALAYLVGAGVSLGPEVLVSPFAAVVPPTPLPTFPPLAALPESSGPLTWVLPVFAILAGALIGLAISRLAARESPLIRIVLALGAAALAAGWVYLLLWMSSGSLGDGRLSHIGPDEGLGALLAGACLVIGALPTSVLRAQRRSRRLRVVTPVDGAASAVGVETPA